MDNVRTGNVVGTVVNGFGIVADAMEVAVPGVPGVAGAMIKGAKALDKATDAIKAVDKGRYS